MPVNTGSNLERGTGYGGKEKGRGLGREGNGSLPFPLFRAVLPPPPLPFLRPPRRLAMSCPYETLSLSSPPPEPFFLLLVKCARE